MHARTLARTRAYVRTCAICPSPQATPATVLSGHGRKVMFVQFHPTASNVLASVSGDMTIKLWDIEHGKQRSELSGLTDLVQSISFNADGSSLAVTSKDKKLRIFDVRTGKVTHETLNHEGVKNQRVIWLGNTPRVATTGFSKTSDRQMYIRDVNNITEPLVVENIDTSSGVLMPFYDEDSKMLYLAGKVGALGTGPSMDRHKSGDADRAGCEIESRCTHATCWRGGFASGRAPPRVTATSATTRWSTRSRGSLA